MKTMDSMDDVLGSLGADLGTSDWVRIDQSRIDLFAEATGDHQWIHVDVERAKAESPFGSTIAHGFLTLSMIPILSKDLFVVRGAKMAVNYGLNKVRFVSPVPVGSRIRLHSEVAAVDKTGDNTVNLTVRHTVQIEGNDKPAAVAELIARYVF
ncbi:putative enoyl-CoA hydratase 1 [Mycolicibacterium anyangense]|jgi:acyl dehydratase|uniref:Putative enoyl-CoA hydratase 1 n=1 Tax=Mycolicibacterium anyangense TaxID=1431246 RepID=A0A6N4W829_9MYCO|nr:MaoC family dehydratase [Mycolicibacterium anyangense]BBZ75521.1 putative enoyl-CoA hydratase 1 [Mycolicibacterium anyangense]